jgi:hypothetical protein
MISLLSRAIVITEILFEGSFMNFLSPLQNLYSFFAFLNYMLIIALIRYEKNEKINLEI